jgi:aminopeptidase N
MTQFISNSLVPAMYDDGFDASRPLAREVQYVNDIKGLFDSTTYNKGAALLFMLESIVGEVNFRDGIRVK